MTPAEVARELLAEARRTDERRLLVLAGERDATVDAATAVLEALAIGIADTVAIAEGETFRCETIEPDRSTEIMGTTRTVVLVDLHAGTVPNVLGRATGAVDGGGLLVLLTPSFAEWPDRRDAFDEGLVVAPFTREDVRGAFRRRLVATLSDHPGIAVVDVDSGRVVRDGLTGGEPADPPAPPDGPPPDARFPKTVYARCLTRDQSRVVQAFERLLEPSNVVVVSAERGRGKSSAAGLAAAALADDGETVGVTAPERANTRALFARAREAVAELTGVDAVDEPIETPGGGSIAYLEPLEAADAAEAGELDVLFVDEAAGLPVATLERYLSADRVGFTTTRHGYEGAAHGFSVRFRDRLAEAPKTETDVQMSTPIRYAPGDPIESWANRALLLDARPPVDEVVRDATSASVEYRRLDPAGLADDRRLREIMGLLALAHYRTEPDDLARVLDAPNLEVAVLEHAGHLACVALLAREGNLPRERREAAYAGERLRGNMLPDIFINVFRDAAVTATPGLRVVRIATHPAVRRRGLASALLEAIQADLADEVEWVGTGFGATPGLVRFWTANGFVPISLSATRNRASGAHSVIMLDTDSARPYADELPDRLRASLSDVHRAVDPGVAIAIFEAISPVEALTIDDAAWRRLAAAADGPGQYDLDPDPARRLAVRGLMEDNAELSERQARLLVAKVLQGHEWGDIADRLGYHSIGQCRRDLGDALSALLDAYGGEAVAAERRALGHGE